MILNIATLIFGAVLALYLLWSFIVSERERKKKVIVQDEFFERRMTEILSSPDFDPNNFVISLTPCADFPELRIDVIEMVRDEEEPNGELIRTHNGFGHEWTRRGRG